MPSGSYSERIIDQFGRPVKGAIVNALIQGVVIASAVTDANGDFTLTAPIDIYRLEAIGNGWAWSEDNVYIGVAQVDVITALTTGLFPYTLPDEADGDTIPDAGSKLPYLSGGVFKIA